MCVLYGDHVKHEFQPEVLFDKVISDVEEGRNVRDAVGGVLKELERMKRVPG